MWSEGISDCIKPQEEKLIYGFQLTDTMHSFPPLFPFISSYPYLTSLAPRVASTSVLLEQSSSFGSPPQPRCCISTATSRR